jgi:arylsulfatase A
MKTSSCVSFSLLLFSLSLFGSEKKPNLILIMSDDMGYECVRANGGTSFQTPHLDELASTGARFTHCYSQPLCTPSRVKIMTGMSNARNYVQFGVLDRKQTTFAHLLKKEGYATCIVGKWQLGKEADSPQHFGFDESCLWQHTRAARDQGKDTRYPNPHLEINGQAKDYNNGEYGPDVVTDYLCDFIERNQDRPFLGYYPMILPHDPFRPTPDSENPKSKDGTQNFRDMVSYVDKMVGKIVSKLDELGLRENTLVLFTCDNGTSGAIKSELNGKMVQGGKRQMTDAGTHVPLIANWPKTIPEKQVIDDLVDFSDFLPTLLEAAQSPLPTNLTLDGQSFLPQITGKQGNPRKWVHCYYRRGNEKAQQWARTQRYKLYKTGEFFDVSKDRLEGNPLQKLDTDQKRIHEMLKGVLHQFSDSYKPEEKNVLLSDAASPPTVCLPANQNLFEGNNFSQWTKLNGQPVGKGWTITDGVVFRKGGDKDIITKNRFRDFSLSFQWKISEAGNSGIKYRTQGRYGLEYQILDDAKHRDNKILSHRAGSLYDLIPAPENKPIRAVGEWNHGKIIAQENVIEHWMNGKKIVGIIWGSKDWEEVFGKSKYKDQKGFGGWEGPILLQDHSDPVWFKELHISEL